MKEYIEKFLDYKNLLLYGTAILFVFTASISPYLSFLFALCIIGLVLLMKKGNFELMVLIMVIPYAQSSLFEAQIMGLPGLKAINLLASFVIVKTIITRERTLVNRAIEKFLICYLILFIVTALRTVPHLDQFSYYIGEDLSALKFLMSYMIKPILLLMPMVICVFYIKHEKEICEIFHFLNLSVLTLSIIILLLYALVVPDKMSFQSVRSTLSEYLGMHGNDTSSFFVAAYPLLLAQMFKRRSWFLVLILVLELITIGILYSRGAYLSIILATIIFMILSQRKRMLPVAAGAFSLFVMFLPQTIIRRALTGLADNDLNAISAGRVSNIWLPLLNEYVSQPFKLIFGNGRHAINYSAVRINGTILPVGQSHNAYLETIVDSGIIGLIFFLVFFTFIIVYFTRSNEPARKVGFFNELCGVETAVIVFLQSCFTDKVFFPSILNAYIWIAIGIGIAIVRHCHKVEVIEEQKDVKNIETRGYINARKESEKEKDVFDFIWSVPFV